MKRIFQFITIAVANLRTVSGIKKHQGVPRLGIPHKPIQTSFNLAFGGAYRSESYSSDAMDASGLELSSSGFVVGGMVYRSFQASKTGNIVPDAGVSYFSQTLKMTDTGTQTETEVDANVTLFSLGASVAAPLSSGNVLNFRAGADIPDEGDARFNAAIGFLLPINLSQ